MSRAINPFLRNIIHPIQPYAVLYYYYYYTVPRSTRREMSVEVVADVLAYNMYTSRVV